MPEHQLIEKMKSIAKRNIFGFVSFHSGLKFIVSKSTHYKHRAVAHVWISWRNSRHVY